MELVMGARRATASHNEFPLSSHRLFDRLIAVVNHGPCRQPTRGLEIFGLGIFSDKIMRDIKQRSCPIPYRNGRARTIAGRT
jgi:hypothetical protein